MTTPNLGNAFKPAPLQPTALVRSDDAGMYVAVGGGTTSSATSPGAAGELAGRMPGRPMSVIDNSPQSQRRGGGGYGDSPSPGSSINTAAHNDQDNRPRSSGGALMSSDALRGSNSPLRRQQQQLDYSGATTTAGQQQDGTTRAGSAQRSISLEHHYRNGGHGHHSANKQPWLSGWTLDCCKNAPTCLDAFMFPWCIHGMQWQKLHENRKNSTNSRTVKENKRSLEDEEMSRQRYRTGQVQSIDELLDPKKRHKLPQQAQSTTASPQATTANGARAILPGATATTASDGTDRDTMIVKKQQATGDNAAAADSQVPQPAPRRSIYEPMPNDDGYGNRGCMSACCDRIDQIDWVCCAGTFFLDLVTLPLLATPFGSAAAQYHIRKEMRIRFNIVPAPGSMTEEEEQRLKDEAKLEELRKENHRREKEMKKETERKFGKIWPDAKQRGDQQQTQQQQPQSPQQQDDASQNSNAQLTTNGGQQHQQPEEPPENKETFAWACKACCSNIFCCGCFRTDTTLQDKNSHDAVSDETKDILLAWCCSCCSAAQVQRELLLRDEFPGGFFSGPVVGYRYGLASRGELSVAAALREIDGIQSPPKERQPWMDEETHIVRDSSVPPSRRLAPPPPTPNENRHMGDGHHHQRVNSGHVTSAFTFDDHAPSRRIAEEQHVLRHSPRDSPRSQGITMIPARPQPNARPEQ